MDEFALIQLALQQDEQAWESLVRAHQQAVFRLAYLFTGDPDEAEDVAQEAFIRAFHFLDKYDRSRPFRPWVLSIAANLARNRLRSFKRYLAVLQGAGRRELDRTPLHPSQPAPAEDAQELWQNIRKLGLEDQQVIYLRYFLELSEEETSIVLQIPAGTVKSRLHRALSRLRTRLQQASAEVYKGVKP